MDGKIAIIYLKNVLYRDIISVPQEGIERNATYSHPLDMLQFIIINPGQAKINGNKVIIISKIILFVFCNLIPTYT